MHSHCMLQIMLGARLGPCTKKCKTPGLAVRFTKPHQSFHVRNSLVSSDFSSFSFWISNCCTITCKNKKNNSLVKFQNFFMEFRRCCSAPASYNVWCRFFACGVYKKLSFHLLHFLIPFVPIQSRFFLLLQTISWTKCRSIAVYYDLWLPHSDLTSITKFW